MDENLDKKYYFAALGIFNNRIFITYFEKVVKEKSANLNIVSQQKLRNADSNEKLKLVLDMAINLFASNKRKNRQWRCEHRFYVGLT